MLHCHTDSVPLVRVWELAEELHVLSADILELIRPHDPWVTSHLAAVPRQALDAIRAAPPAPKWHAGEYYEWHTPPPGYRPAPPAPPTPTRPRRRRYRRRPGPKLISFEPPYEETNDGYGNNPTEDLRYEPIWSTRDVARYYGLTPATIRQWVRRGHLEPCGTSGPSHIFAREDVYAAAGAVARRRKTTATPAPATPPGDPHQERPSGRRPPRGRRPNDLDQSSVGIGSAKLQRLAAVTPKALVTTNEAATLLGLAPATIRAWVRRGHLAPATPPAGQRQLHFRLADLDQAARRR